MVAKHSNYSIQNHFPEGYESSKNLYEEFQNKLLALDSRIQPDPKKKYIGFKIGSKVVIAVSVLQSKLKLQLYRVEPSDLIDPNNKVKYKSNSFEDFNKYISMFDIVTIEDVDYGIGLSKQVIQKFFN